MDLNDLEWIQMDFNIILFPPVLTVDTGALRHQGTDGVITA